MKNFCVLFGLLFASNGFVFSQATNVLPTTGNVGVGTLAPIHKLEVKDGDLYLNKSAIDGGVIRSFGHVLEFKGANDNNYAHRYYRFYPSPGAAGPTYSVLELYSGKTDSFFDKTINIASSGYTYFNGGNVGIGNATPMSKLSVFQSSNSFPALLLENNGGQGFGLQIKAGSGGSDYSIMDAMTFSGVSRFYVRGDGNVGVGTTTPSSKLTVQGGVSVDGVNSIASVNGFNNAIQLINPSHAAIVYNPGQASELMFGMHSNGGFYWGTGYNSSIGSKYLMSLSKEGRLSGLETLYLNVGVYVGGNELNSRLGCNDLQFNRAENTSYISNVGRNGSLAFTTGGGSENLRMMIFANGNVGIGTTDPKNCKLAVEGTIGAREVVVLAPGTAWPDYVFAPDYKLRTLDEIEQFVKDKQHLPDVPSAEAVAKDGVNLGEMNAILLKKVEELTLHLIEQNKKVESVIEQNKALLQEVTYLKGLVVK